MSDNGSAIDSPRCKCGTTRMQTRIVANGASNAAPMIEVADHFIKLRKMENPE